MKLIINTEIENRVNMNENEKTELQVKLSINKLIGVFQDALIGMVEPLEKASITWESYEDFEEIESISESLFNLLVKYQLEDYIQSKYSFEIKIPQYGFYHKNYEAYHPIQVNVEGSEDRYIFVLFESKNGPFDTVMCDKVDEKGNIISRENEFLVENVDFMLVVNTK